MPYLNLLICLNFSSTQQSMLHVNKHLMIFFVFTFWKHITTKALIIDFIIFLTIHIHNIGHYYCTYNTNVTYLIFWLALQKIFVKILYTYSYHFADFQPRECTYSRWCLQRVLFKRLCRNQIKLIWLVHQIISNDFFCLW